MNKTVSNRKLSASLRCCVSGVVLTTLLSACGGRGNEGVAIPEGASSATSLAVGPGIVAPSGAAPVQAPTLAQQATALERSGAYPALDRSSDTKGPDANGNGVRDDIEAWINAQSVNDGQRRALMQKARALQRTLVVELQDQRALQEAGEGLAASSNCGIIQFSPYSTFSRFAGKIEAMTANTKERAARYMQYNAARSGSSTTLPDGDTCES